ncbi:hypothetical protein AVEN_193124-1 [Araneus ventricosus]|uniref:Uncharacterized protein n=1 Tax=Araneus ventricosus TaxID=182803 RepID=A0A4Y2B3N8_ARAVE|nr:hypothetical protein AVEN_193124-1 [Araneus ventricosus]
MEKKKTGEEERERSQITSTTPKPNSQDSHFVSGGELGIWGKVVNPFLIACDDPEKKVRDEDVRQPVKNFLRSLGTDFYQDDFLKVSSRNDKCMSAGGEYVEK